MANVGNISQIIDGKALAAKHEAGLRDKIHQLKVAYLNQNVNLEFEWPRLVSFSNFEDPITHKYTQLKGEKAKQLGILFIVLYTYNGLKMEDLTHEFMKQNQDPKNSGIMVQLPLPTTLQSYTEKVISMINPDKDVDGLTGKGSYLPATVRGVLSIFVDQHIYPDDKLFSVVGSEGVVGKGMVAALTKAGARVIQVDQRRPQTSLEDIKHSDVIVSCTGVQSLIKPTMIKEGAILIDVGLGDFDPACMPKASAYTPQVGGVGPMTVISLMENVVDAWEKKIKT